MSNLSMSWNKWYLIAMIPLMLIGFLPLLKMTLFKPDMQKDLVISESQKRQNGQSLEIIGLITNSSTHKWSSVSVEAEFFDSKGQFIDEASEYLRADVGPSDKEHFKIVIKNPSPGMLAPESKMTLKLSGGHSMPF